MTEERAKTIFDAIEAYKESLFKMSPEEAAKALGGDFTVDEIIEVGKALQTVASCVGADGEVDQAELEKIAGGGSLWGSAVMCLGTWGAAGLLVAGGVAAGLIMW